MRRQGFTLIELMIVVAIVGVLAAIALPVYQDYVARSQVAEAVMGSGQVKTALSTFYASQGEFPPAGEYASTGGRYVASLTHDANGVVLATMGPAVPVSTLVRGMQLTLTPECTAAPVKIANWICAPVVAAQLKYIPSGCQVSPAGVAASNC